MATPPDSLNDIARAIQLALAPAFLLSGIVGLLNVMVGRLARIVDRGRGLTEPVAVESFERDSVHRELQNLERRRHLTGVAITAATIASMLLCVVIALLFVEVMLYAPLTWLIGTLLTVSTMALIVSLTFFLREVHLAMWAGRFKLLAPSKNRQDSATLLGVPRAHQSIH
jgi:hypothetical protein